MFCCSYLTGIVLFQSYVNIVGITNIGSFVLQTLKNINEIHILKASRSRSKRPSPLWGEGRSKTNESGPPIALRWGEPRSFFCRKMSGIRELNPCLLLGKQPYCHCTNPACFACDILLYGIDFVALPGHHTPLSFCFSAKLVLVMPVQSEAIHFEPTVLIPHASHAIFFCMASTLSPFLGIILRSHFAFQQNSYS